MPSKKSLEKQVTRAKGKRADPRLRLVERIAMLQGDISNNVEPALHQMGQNIERSVGGMRQPACR